jgi:hypothetical protein
VFKAKWQAKPEVWTEELEALVASNVIKSWGRPVLTAVERLMAGTMTHDEFEATLFHFKQIELKFLTPEEREMARIRQELVDHRRMKALQVCTADVPAETTLRAETVPAAAVQNELRGL